MTHLPPEAHRWFATQHGVASVGQLRSTGLSTRQIERLADVGAIVSVLRGAYRSASRELDEYGRCAAVCLARPEVAIAGPTAGRLWGFRRLPHDRRIHVIAPPAAQPAIAPWVATYRTAAIHDHDVVEHTGGIRFTSRERTVFDLARTLGHDDLLSLIEQAMHDGRLDDTAMIDVAVDWLSPQRRWAWTYLRQLDRRHQGGAAESHPEVVVAERLRAAGLGGLVRQYPIELPGYGRARFDLAVPDLLWALEVDVHPTHGTVAGRHRDQRRDDAATAIGWQTTRLRRDTYEFRLDAWVESTMATFRSLRTRAS